MTSQSAGQFQLQQDTDNRLRITAAFANEIVDELHIIFSQLTSMVAARTLMPVGDAT